MHTQVLILFGVDKYLVVVITRAMPSSLDYVYQILSGDSVPAVCPLRYFRLLSCAGFAKSTYSMISRQRFDKEDRSVSQKSIVSQSEYRSSFSCRATLIFLKTFLQPGISDFDGLAL